MYADFKRQVIVPAVEELNSTNYFDIEFIENKNGRKVDSITFIVKDFDDRRYFSKKENTVSLDTKQNKTNKKISEISRQKTKFHNFNETFTKYTTDALDDIIAKSQKEKFK
ncbi:RepB family plasmid replication initiator protein [Clostridioides sp. ES-S-0108-01]|uniref:RepB family plasmid replication initiator protein n=1 Tax=unclassified Clostridioides TaxID=2635829 RepID=UPI001D0C2336|nr:RepB family plasmid replication initiator protein [Clostridioides sp. ES-S-0107-01]MCC0785136.1 RepB family plasmid replication initiator protein [Clostridioides sp. ES-S-0108-01]UDN53034.1 RepB family plasmid replication initiator protein [Clostridioides sp. ES-S-0107-01]